MNQAIENGLDIIGSTLEEAVELVGALKKFSHLQELGPRQRASLVETYPGNPSELAFRTSAMSIRTKIVLGGRAKATIEIEYSIMVEPSLDVDIRWTTSNPISPVRAFILAREHQEAALLAGKLEDLFQTMARKLEGCAVKSIQVALAKGDPVDDNLAKNIQPILETLHEDQETRLDRARQLREEQKADG